MRAIVLWFLVIGVPFGKAEDIYRLPQDVKPNHYNIDLIINEVAVTNYNGVVSIFLTILQTTNEIRFHAKNIEILTVSLTDENGGEIHIGDGPYTSDSVTDQVVITTTESLSGSYVLTIQFKGFLNDGLEGFYLSSYKENGETKYLGTTQFEEVGARKAFPCFDEPLFKSTFNISLTFPQEYNALGNTPLAGPVEAVDDGLLKASFETTPMMSTYLVAFIVSQYTCTRGLEVQPGTFTEVCSRPDTLELRELALDFAPKVLHVVEEYTGIRYGDTGIGKMSQAAIPDFAAGAMENWGLVTFQEYMLLYDEDDGESAKSMVVTTIAHEFGHQWFGDLVTLGWWSDVFLNEGFATYFEYFATDKIYPEWNLEDSFVTGALEEALYVDAYLDSLPLSYPNVSSPRDAGNRFDSISYDKGGSIIRMVQHILGIDNFIAGLKNYIDEFKNKNTLANDLWNGLAPYADNLPTDTNFVEVMENWTFKAGYPILTVVSNGTDVIISQERYLEDGSDDTKWYVPITYTLSGSDPNDTKPKTWLTPNEDLTLAGVLANSDAIVLNNLQTGYYRVNYDDNLLRKISNALRTQDFSGIHPVNRAQIIDDLFNIAKIGLRSYSEVFDFLHYLENETHYTPWTAAFRNFQYLLRKLRNKSLTSQLNVYITNLASMFDKSSSSPQTHTEILKQTLSHTWACKLNDETCLKYASDQFKKTKVELKSPENKDLTKVVYCNGLRYSSNPEEDWSHLWKLLGKSSTTRPLIIDSLGCISDKIILEKYLQKILYPDSGIRKHEIEKVLSAVYSNSFEGVDITLDFVLANYQEIVKRLGKPNRFTAVLKSIADYLTTYEQFEKLTSFVVGAKLEDSIRENLLPEMSKVKRNLDWIEGFENQMMEYFPAQ